MRSVVPYLSRDFRQALLEYQKETQGTKTAKTRWLSCVEDLNGYFHGLSFALGYMWVQKVFDVEIIPFVSKTFIVFSLSRVNISKIAFSLLAIPKSRPSAHSHANKVIFI